MLQLIYYMRTKYQHMLVFGDNEGGIRDDEDHVDHENDKERMIVRWPDVNEASSIRNDCPIIVTLKPNYLRFLLFVSANIVRWTIRLYAWRCNQVPDSMERTRNLWSRCRNRISCYQLLGQPVLMLVAIIMTSFMFSMWIVECLFCIIVIPNWPPQYYCKGWLNTNLVKSI